MKKKLRAELVSLAHRILQMNAEANYAEMKREAQHIYETLSVLAFAERHFDGVQPTIGKSDIIVALQAKDEQELNEIIEEIRAPEVPRLEKPAPLADDNVKRLEEIAKANELIFEKARSKKTPAPITDQYRPNSAEVNKNQDSLHEPVIEKIKDMVAQMPPEADAIEDMFQEITSGQNTIKNDKDDIGEYGRLAQFEKKEDRPEKSRAEENRPEINKKPIAKPQTAEPRQKSLNDSLNKSLSIGLNDRIVFIKHLFSGSATDYNRVLSQLNTQHSWQDALHFIDNMIKPDYNNWKGKEVYEHRFKELIEKKFNA